MQLDECNINMMRKPSIVSTCPFRIVFHLHIPIFCYLPSHTAMYKVPVQRDMNASSVLVRASWWLTRVTTSAQSEVLSGPGLASDISKRNGSFVACSWGAAWTLLIETELTHWPSAESPKVLSTNNYRVLRYCQLSWRLLAAKRPILLWKPDKEFYFIFKSYRIEAGSGCRHRQKCYHMLWHRQTV